MPWNLSLLTRVLWAADTSLRVHLQNDCSSSNSNHHLSPSLTKTFSHIRKTDTCPSPVERQQEVVLWPGGKNWGGTTKP